ncbi:hypothetical protein BXZ70DRAFT_476761 [Cristinia sonorae]|uniref:F-box domain-containing protein n=1 Tax=Cristinia sonorae TaxID=1940300 RepID=A0A8K0UI16_9AGAR|nr:hypothetical protein BXZ70DRAFT_476761 [Cristinia sonorae]
MSGLAGHDAVSKDELRNVIELQVQQHFTAISQLRGFLNKVIPPISRLPVEVLADIFRWCLPDTATVFTPRRRLSWISVTHVCRYWRDVALQTPTLWTAIPVGQGSVPFAKEFLARSRRSPLRIYITVNVALRKWASISRSISQELGRVKQLTIFTPSSSLLAFQDHAPPSFPSLRNLDLSQPPKEKSRVLPAFCAHILSHSPILDKLKIREYRIQWKTFTLPLSVTDLSLSCGENDGFDWKSTGPDIIHLISNLPALRCLELVGIFMTQIPAVSLLPPVTTTATLLRLETINVTGNVLACTHFLQHCTFPPSTSVKLSLFADTVANLHGLKSTLASIINARVTHGGPEQSVSLDIYPRSVYLRVGSRGPWGELPLFLFLSTKSRVAIPDIWPQIPMDHVTTLFISGNAVSSAFGNAWVDLIAGAHNVDDLVISDTKDVDPFDINALLRAHDHNMAGMDTPLRHCLVFPKLISLSLQGVQFRDQEGGWEAEMSSDSGEDEDEEGNEDEGESEGESEGVSDDESSGGSEGEVDRDGSGEAEETHGGEDGNSDSSDAGHDDSDHTSRVDEFDYVKALIVSLQARRVAGHPLEVISLDDCINMDRRDVDLLGRYVTAFWDGLVRYDDDSETDDDSYGYH